MPNWNRTDLKRPTALLAGVLGFVASAPVALLVSCNVHELGHALVATLLGWEVERVHLCRPTGGRVEYAQVGSWGTLEGLAGGLVAAAFLLAAYAVVFASRRMLLRGPGWWASGLGVLLWVGPQIVIAILEGGADLGQDYGEIIRDAPVLWGSLMAASMLAGATAHAWRWRAPLREPLQRPPG